MAMEKTLFIVRGINHVSGKGTTDLIRDENGLDLGCTYLWQKGYRNVIYCSKENPLDFTVVAFDRGGRIVAWIAPDLAEVVKMCGERDPRFLQQK